MKNKIFVLVLVSLVGVCLVGCDGVPNQASGQSFNYQWKNLETAGEKTQPFSRSGKYRVRKKKSELDADPIASPKKSYIHNAAFVQTGSSVDLDFSSPDSVQDREPHNSIPRVDREREDVSVVVPDAKNEIVTTRKEQVAPVISEITYGETSGPKTYGAVKQSGTRTEQRLRKVQRMVEVEEPYTVEKPVYKRKVMQQQEVTKQVPVQRAVERTETRQRTLVRMVPQEYVQNYEVKVMDTVTEMVPQKTYRMVEVGEEEVEAPARTESIEAPPIEYQAAPRVFPTQSFAKPFVRSPVVQAPVYSTPPVVQVQPNICIECDLNRKTRGRVRATFGNSYR